MCTAIETQAESSICHQIIDSCPLVRFRVVDKSTATRKHTFFALK